MLNTLNKAWVTILAQHTDEHNIFVYTTASEKEMIETVFKEVAKNIGIEHWCYAWIVSESEVREMKNKNISFFPKPNNILISHDLVDVTIKDYLKRQCKKK